MTSSISNFFTRDDMLKRQGRTARARRNAGSSQSGLFASTSLRSKPLNIIIEEDESRPWSRSPSPRPICTGKNGAGGSSTQGLKARRRHANISDIRIARDMPIHDENDLSPLHDNLLSSPRPAPSPPQSSPDSFKLTFPGASLKFPHPPIASPTSILGHYHDLSECGSPTRSASSRSSSPCSQSGGMPLTPSSSDDESSLPTRIVNPRRVSIHPLVITKHNQRIYDELSISPSSLPVETKDAPEETYDSDPESDSEWYNREFSKIITLRSPLPPSFPHHASRPDSMSISADEFALAPSAKLRRRVSKVLPPTPTSPELKRASRIPKYPPPPVPVTSSRASLSPSPSSGSSQSFSDTSRRPPPRSSVPADFAFDFDEENDADDSSSAFSFSMYEIDLGDQDFERPQSVGSAYSQPSFEFENDEEEDEFSDQDVTFDMDYSMMLPLSLPATPIDLEADIAMGLEQLRNSDNEASPVEEKEFVFEAKEVADATEEQVQVVQQQPAQQLPAVVNDVFSPVSPCFSPPSFLPYYFNDSLPCQSPPPAPKCVYNEERVLKSKWSSSTLASVREEHESRGASSKLRLYFSGQSSSTKRSSQTNSRSSKVPATPTSPFGSFMSPRKSLRAHDSHSSPAASPSPSPLSAKTRPAHVHSRGNSAVSDVIVIGYGNGGVGVRRRGSVSTISDAGTEASSSSTSSSGLRRKPIPVEMFLRSAA